MVLECILLLCQTRQHRETLRKKKVYVIVRNFDFYLNTDEEEKKNDNDTADKSKIKDKAVASVFGGFITANAKKKSISGEGKEQDEEEDKPLTALGAAKESLSNIIYEIINFLARDEDPEVPVQPLRTRTATTATVAATATTVTTNITTAAAASSAAAAYDNEVGNGDYSLLATGASGIDEVD